MKTLATLILSGILLVIASSDAPRASPGAGPRMLLSGAGGSRSEANRSSEQAPFPHHTEPYVVDTRAQESLAVEGGVAFRQVVRSPGAAWLRLHFGDYDLGERNTITITSLQDGGQQRLDAKSLPKWQNATALFNGDAVEVALHAAPGETGVFFRLEEITVGEPGGRDIGQGAPEAPESQCGPTDDRTASTDPAVGRIMPVGCTGWIVSNGANLTAGHCVGASMQVLQFNVPASLSNGTPVNPPPQDQYPIEPMANIDWFDDGNGAIGNDWAVFETFENSNTGRLAVHVQGAFYRMSRDDNPANVRVTGYGLDFVPAGPGGGPAYCPTCNANSQTLQTHSGAYLGETVQGASDVFIEYTVDTEGGNSGSPVISTANGVTLGIHTNGGCNPPSTGNTGTGFEHDNLESAIQTFPGATVRYVDNGHPVATEDGTVFRPYDTFIGGVTAAPSGAILSLVRGTYDEATPLVITKALLIEAPVGAVTIR